ncbi:hypothetical protein IV417_18950 [Alphaproteobacteria bacterium KMM 3653]|uniref:Uncharacterized protein n=1 Tax=Harenicola maris TaxID=2841044 RepID=A0AAP2CT05_9RHOB|nr:hypothetical protein [Harenicola maris]
MQLSLFDIPAAPRPAETGEVSNDYHLLPATAKQQDYARQIALRANLDLPGDVLSDRRRLSEWIDAHKTARPGGRFANYPSSKQVAFAERVARMKRNPVPPECFRDRALMSKWIDRNR